MQTNEHPETPPNQGRQGDGMLVVVQNNEEKSLVIEGVNEVIEALLGYDKGEITGHKLETILGKQLAETIAEDLEYDDQAPDFGEIFQRIRQVKLRRRVGDEITVTMNLTRLLAQGRHSCFQLIVPNERERVATTRLREFIALNLEGRAELDEATGLPNHKTAKEFLPVLKNYVGEEPMNIVFAVLKLDRFDKSVARYGKVPCVELMKHANHVCRTTFRSQDLVFALSDRMLGVVLFDISRESTRVVMNRLRWKMKSHRFTFGGKSDFSISVSVGFDMLDLERTDAIFDGCEKAMAELDAAERSALVELNAEPA